MDFVISLERTPHRLRWFRAKNPHLTAEHVPAADGKALDFSAMNRDGIVAPGLAYNEGALGCLMSHLGLWRNVIDTDHPATIFEDDAVVHRDFLARRYAFMKTVPADWHIILWGWNFDAPMTFEMLPGVSSCVGTFDQNRMRGAIDTYQAMSFKPDLFRVRRAFGTAAYSISPGGAAAIQQLCLPVRPMALTCPGLAQPMPNIGLDVTLSAVYESLNAYVCFPPLVVTPNYQGGSAIKEGYQQS